MRWVHPVRVAALRFTTAVMTVLWGLAAAITIWHGFPAHAAAQVVLAGVGVYGIGLSLVWPWVERRDRA
jgi:hypothetical protein